MSLSEVPDVATNPVRTLPVDSSAESTSPEACSREIGRPDTNHNREVPMGQQIDSQDVVALEEMTDPLSGEVGIGLRGSANLPAPQTGSVMTMTDDSLVPGPVGMLRVPADPRRPNWTVRLPVGFRNGVIALPPVRRTVHRHDERRMDHPSPRAGARDD